MKVEQYVMAYGIEQDRVRAILPEGFVSLRPVLRINAEIRDEKNGYVEFNTAVEKDGKKGWLNIGYWENVPFTRNGKTTIFQTDFLELSFTGVAVEGSCPAEKDNDGCFFLGETEILKPAEHISEKKEFCDCSFQWKFTDGDARITASVVLSQQPPFTISNTMAGLSFPKKVYLWKPTRLVAVNSTSTLYLDRWVR